MKKQGSEYGGDRQYAYIFDFDGVLGDSMRMIFNCYNDVFEEYGFQVDYESYNAIAGTTLVESISSLCQSKNKNLDVESVALKVCELYNHRIGEAPPIKCNLQLAQALKNSGVQVAVASGSPRGVVKSLLDDYGLVVDVVVSGGDVEKGKPEPDVFLKAAELIGVEPDNCVVVEDSRYGVIAARAAGMKVLKFIDNI